MLIDLHTHVGGLLGANIFRPANFKRLRTRLFLRAFGVSTERDATASSLEERIVDVFLRHLHESKIDKAVVLALDRAYTEDGRQDQGTRYAVADEYVLSVVEKSPKAFFGCSIHPYRKDAEECLEAAVKKGAVLVKWIPSTQNIDPASERCRPFYELLKHFDLPLLTHTGYEHTINTFSQKLNAPQRLEPALKQGVKVIAAHCGARLLPHEQNFYSEWAEMTRRYENLYGDISAFLLPLRYLTMRKLLASKELQARILYGSDYPALNWPAAYLPTLGTGKVKKLSSIKNPIQRSLETMQALGLADSVFTGAESILRLPKTDQRPSRSTLKR